MSSPAPNYELRFRLLAILYIPHHALLAMAMRNNKPRLARVLHRTVRKRLSGGTALRPHTNQSQKEYLSKISSTTMWHGTGRFQHQKDKMIDVLQEILSTGCLQPKRDVYSLTINGKEMCSLSGTRLRVIARSYADTHGLGVNEQDRNGSSLWWAAYYYGLCYAQLFAKRGITVARNWSKFEQASRDANGERTWGKKANKNAKYVWDVFGLGSDIPDNYPILFGIAIDLNRSQAPRFLEQWEVRIVEPVTLSEVTHLEVPQAKIAEVRALLKRHGHEIPVFPIELGEWLAAQQEIGGLLYPIALDDIALKTPLFRDEQTAPCGNGCNNKRRYKKHPTGSTQQNY